MWLFQIVGCKFERVSPQTAITVALCSSTNQKMIGIRTMEGMYQLLRSVLDTFLEVNIMTK